MSYRKKKQLKRIELPLTGSDLSQVKDESLITLLFVDERGSIAQLVLEQAVTIYQPDTSPNEVVGTKPGVTFDPSAIQPILKLIGKKVKQGIAHQDGSLEIEFYDGVKFEVIPDIYEGWHFQKPAPGTMAAYPKEHFSLHGSDGELI